MESVADAQKVKGDGEKFVVSLKDDNKLPAGMYKMKVSAFDNDTQTTTTEVLQLKVRPTCGRSSRQRVVASFLTRRALLCMS